MVTGPKTSCDCCGTCCRKGGPALHTEDYDLLTAGLLSFDDLITVRQGEYVHHPMHEAPQPADRELIKIRGKGADWCCHFLDSEKSLCMFYEHRPLACRLLKCWAPDEVIAIAGKNLLDRFSLIPENEPVAALIRKHEEDCSLRIMHSLTAQLHIPELRKEIIDLLTVQVNLDCRIRGYAVREYNLTLARELFYFGRPLFQLLIPFGLSYTAAPGGEILQCVNT
ncbi:MAG: YkgJ family cysteine cluster protein [Desulfobulbaceae bacterium]|nr:YkgJ family cysteine cluster protein [Desulfobulbaceae bacterium]